jgi:hypothetical protein
VVYFNHEREVNEMIAVLEFVDGFGADTNVTGIYQSLEDAIAAKYGNEFKYQEFEFGKVSFDIYECKTYDGGKKQKKKRKK